MTHAAGIDLELSDGVTRPFTQLLLDYNGTLACDGELLPGVAERLTALGQSLLITVLTADTFSKAETQLAGLPVELRIVRNGADKLALIKELAHERVIAIGNGRNDLLMMKLAGLAIAVIGAEGASTELLLVSDVVSTNVHHALDLIINPLRIKATLRN